MIYLVFFAVLCFLTAVLNKDRKHIIFTTIVVGGLMSLMVGLRAPSVGNDTINYNNIFNWVNDYSQFFQPYGGIEYGYVLLMRFAGLLSKDSQMGILVAAFVTIIPMVYTVNKYSETPWFSIALIFGLGFFTQALNIVRQAIAISIIFAAMPCLYNKNVKKYVFAVLLAMFFHKSAIFAIVLVPLAYIKLKDFTVLFFVAGAFVLALFFDNILSVLAVIFPKYAHYLNGNYFDGTGWRAMLLKILINVTIIIAILTFTKTNISRGRVFSYGINEGGTYRNVFDWTIVLTVILQIIGLRANMMDRIYVYYTVAWVLYFPSLANRIGKKFHRQLFILLLLVIYIAEFVVVQLLRPEWNRILPYKFYWQV